MESLYSSYCGGGGGDFIFSLSTDYFHCNIAIGGPKTTTPQQFKKEVRGHIVTQPHLLMHLCISSLPTSLVPSLELAGVWCGAVEEQAGLVLRARTDLRLFRVIRVRAHGDRGQRESVAVKRMQRLDAGHCFSFVVH